MEVKVEERKDFLAGWDWLNPRADWLAAAFGENRDVSGFLAFAIFAICGCGLGGNWWTGGRVTGVVWVAAFQILR